MMHKTKIPFVNVEKDVRSECIKLRTIFLHTGIFSRVSGIFNGRWGGCSLIRGQWPGALVV